MKVNLLVLLSPLLTLGFFSLHQTLTAILHWSLYLSFKQSEWHSQPISATRLLLSWLKSNQKYIVWKSPSFTISSWSFTVRPSNSCAALTQVNWESLYSFRLIITKILFLPCLPDLSVTNDKVKGGEKKTTEREREREPPSLIVYSWAKLSHARLTPPVLVPANTATVLGQGTSGKELVLLLSPVYHLNSNAICKPLRQVYKKDQSTCWKGKQLYICSDASSPKRQHVP